MLRFPSADESPTEPAPAAPIIPGTSRSGGPTGPGSVQVRSPAVNDPGWPGRGLINEPHHDAVSSDRHDHQEYDYPYLEMSHERMRTND